MAPPDDPLRDCPLALTLARRLRESRTELTERWLERITRRVAIDANRVFPSEELLDHVPLLIEGIADFLAQPTTTVTAESMVIDKARELGALRYQQGFDEYEILKEYEIFGGILFAFLTRTVDSIDEPCTRSELLSCAHRLFLAVALIQQATATHYLQLMRVQLGEREERLRRFNRSLTHELKNQIGAVLGALEILEIQQEETARAPMLDLARRNVQAIRRSLDNLVELSRLDPHPRQQRHVPLASSIAEVVRQFRDTAREAGIAIEVGPLPPIEVAAAGVELVVGNLVSNAIKYADPARRDRWVRITAAPSGTRDDAAVVVEVRDNGIGVPPERRDRLFHRHYRAHEDVTSVEGTGIGLSLVRDTVHELGGRVWAEFPPEGGSVFRFTLPARRSADQGAADAAR